MRPGGRGTLSPTRCVLPVLCKPKAHGRGSSDGERVAEASPASSAATGKGCPTLGPPCSPLCLTRADVRSSDGAIRLRGPWPSRGAGVRVCVPRSVAAFRFHSHAAKLGAQLADLHLANKKLGETLQREAGTVGTGLCGPRGTPPGGSHVGARLGCGHVSLRPVSVPEERNLGPTPACLGCRELSAPHGVLRRSMFPGLRTPSHCGSFDLSLLRRKSNEVSLALCTEPLL